MCVWIKNVCASTNWINIGHNQKMCLKQGVDVDVVQQGVWNSNELILWCKCVWIVFEDDFELIIKHITNRTDHFSMQQCWCWCWTLKYVAMFNNWREPCLVFNVQQIINHISSSVHQQTHSKFWQINSHTAPQQCSTTQYIIHSFIHNTTAPQQTYTAPHQTKEAQNNTCKEN